MLFEFDDAAAKALAIVQHDDDPHYVVLWLYSNCNVADSWCETLADAVEATAKEGTTLGWVEMPSR